MGADYDIHTLNGKGALMDGETTGGRLSQSTAGRGQPAGSVLLVEAVLEVASRLEGRAKAPLLAEIANISAPLARKQKGAPRRQRRLAASTAHGEQWLRARLLATGLSESDAQQLLAERPTGLLQSTLYWMSGGDVIHPTSREIVLELEQLDATVSALARALDLDSLLAWLRESAGRQPALFAAVDAAGCPPPPREGMPPLEELQSRLGSLMANMLLSFLAVIDLEVTPRVATHQWSGTSLLAALIAPVEEQGVRSPIALLVDLVLAAGIASVEGALPAERPELVKVARWLAARGAGDPGIERRIDSLRRRANKLDRRALHKLMRDTKLNPAGPGQTIDQEADMLVPVLAAAHLLVGLMPTSPKRKAHPDRRGWRDVYLAWWRRHAEARGLPTVAVAGPGPPAWLTFA